MRPVERKRNGGGAARRSRWCPPQTSVLARRYPPLRGPGLLAMGFWQCLQPSSGSAIRPPAKDVGVWLSLVEHLVRDEGVAGSNPATPTNHFKDLLRNNFWHQYCGDRNALA